MEEIHIDPIQWEAPEYTHKERSPDFLWTIGLVAIVGAIIALWTHNYLFAIFILISGACLILFTIRHPQQIHFTIETEAITLGKEKYEWKSIKGFNITKGSPYSKLLIQTSKKFLPKYSIPFPSERTSEIREALLKVSTEIELEESKSIQFMEKLGF